MEENMDHNMDENMHEDMHEDMGEGIDEGIDEELYQHRLDLELETISLNQLHELGNQAVSLGLVAGHGYRGGQYELLHKDKVVLLPPPEAIAYLDTLIKNAGQ
ncbi:MAG: hypothetical protein MUF49_11255 [Oculatellaceae cyanobacterium Prado106]|jgi:hypothetical protein|nr:hypothetical protein [Oculatellaceae cyanobacterium Prado106]